MATFVLLHSPLVGQLTWAAVAEELGRHGIATLVPSFRGVLAAGAPYAQHLADAVATAVEVAAAQPPLVLVGHSGAGPMLPLCGATIRRPLAAYFFVDAGLPRGGSSALDEGPQEFVEHLRSLARDGWLPPWSDWWGPATLRHHLPSDELRTRFVAELQPVPFALFEERMPKVAGWPNAPCAYLQLSEAYGDGAAQARSMGWPVRVMDGHHLSMLVEPGQVATALLELWGEVARLSS